MLRKIFKPGKGSMPARFSAWFTNGACYRGDLMLLDATAPTDQGASGVLRGETLGTKDFIFATNTEATAANRAGRQLGVCEGNTVGSKDTVNAVADDAIAIVQTYGVHDNVRVAATDNSAEDIITTLSTVPGECAVVAPATVDGTDDVTLASHVGLVLLGGDTTYTRGTVGSISYSVGFVRCDY